MVKYFYTYLVVLTEGSLKGKVYFGKKCTNNLNDGYIGSGKILRDYLKKYPNGYYREIIDYYNSKEELAKAEFELIQPHLGKEYCINLKRGGEGGYGIWTDERKKEWSIKNSGENNPMYGKNAHDYMTPEAIEKKKNKTSQTMKGRPSPLKNTKRPNLSNKLTGRNLSEEHKNNISKGMMGHPGWTKGKTSPIKGEKKVYNDETHTSFHYE